MPIAVSCSCGKSFRVPDQAAGKRARCSRCGNILRVPSSDSEDNAVPEGESYGLAEMPATPSSAIAAPDQPSSRRSPTSTTRPELDEEAKQRARERYKNLAATGAKTHLLDYGYWLLLLTFIPLAFGLLQSKKEDTFERLMRALEKTMAPKEEKAVAKQKTPPRGQKAAPPVVDQSDVSEISLGVLLARLPGSRLEGALLPYGCSLHWLFAVLAGVCFLGLTLVFFGGAGQPVQLLGLAAFTATIGILLLLLAQLLAELTQGHVLISRNAIVMLIYWLIWAIGFSYRAAVDPELGLVPSFLGFTFGVGFCEEVCKVLPLLWRYSVRGPLPWREACAWGFASGVGFGVAEGILYSSRYYNGISGADSYLIRFISCVALHGIWSAAAALFIHNHRDVLQAHFPWYEFVPRALFLVGIPMVLHGLYDAFLKQDMNGLALLAAFASFAWLAWSVERTRALEANPKIALRRA